MQQVLPGSTSKMYRCGMRQAGVLAAAEIYALDHIAPKLHVDHANAH